MRCYSYAFITIFYILINSILGLDEATKNHTVFVPTTEWQTVKKGTPIPKGLHVRHNFQTGITEAKLLDPEETSQPSNDDTPKSLALHSDAIEKRLENDEFKFEQVDKGVKISAEELKAKLKEIKSRKNSFALKTEDAEVRDEKTRFQSYEELKKEFENVSFGKSRDADFLDVFISQFDTHKNAINSGSLNPKEVKVITDILSQLEYLVHDIDNGLEFTRSGGLMKVVYPCLNGTIEEIKCEALRVLGSAVQSNPKVKEVALELEFVPSILRTLTKYESNAKLMDRCIYALGSLARHYPAAQKVFLNHGGLEIFSQILAEGPASTQKRIMNLINDLIVERQELEAIDDLEDQKLKTQDYADVEFEEKIVRHKICSQLGNLLVKTTENEIRTEYNSEDLDLLEAIFECALTAGNICKLEFQQSENHILPALNKINTFYDKLDPDLYSDENYLLPHLVTLVKKIREDIFQKSHDEL